MILGGLSRRLFFLLLDSSSNNLFLTLGRACFLLLSGGRRLLGRSGFLDCSSLRLSLFRWRFFLGGDGLGLGSGGLFLNSGLRLSLFNWRCILDGGGLRLGSGGFLLFSGGSLFDNLRSLFFLSFFDSLGRSGNLVLSGRCFGDGRFLLSGRCFCDGGLRLSWSGHLLLCGGCFGGRGLRLSRSGHLFLSGRCFSGGDLRLGGSRDLFLSGGCLGGGGLRLGGRNLFLCGRCFGSGGLRLSGGRFFLLGGLGLSGLRNLGFLNLLFSGGNFLSLLLSLNDALLWLSNLLGFSLLDWSLFLGRRRLMDSFRLSNMRRLLLSLSGNRLSFLLGRFLISGLLDRRSMLLNNLYRLGHLDLFCDRLFILDLVLLGSGFRDDSFGGGLSHLFLFNFLIHSYCFRSLDNSDSVHSFSLQGRLVSVDLLVCL